jgi:hypothetical protein
MEEGKSSTSISMEEESLLHEKEAEALRRTEIVDQVTWQKGRIRTVLDARGRPCKGLGEGSLVGCDKAPHVNEK